MPSVRLVSVARAIAVVHDWIDVGFYVSAGLFVVSRLVRIAATRHLNAAPPPLRPHSPPPAYYRLDAVDALC